MFWRELPSEHCFLLDYCFIYRNVTYVIPTMGKYSQYVKKYKKEWESLPQFKGWLRASENTRQAFCTVCHVQLRPQKADLQKHSNTLRHKNQFKKYNTYSKITTVGLKIINSESKIQDLKLAVYVATHSATRSIDHLSELIGMLGKGSKLEDLRLHRTKCSSLIKNVIGPSLLQEIIKDIGNREYSLIIDESTDISVCKYLCICVRYFSETLKKIVNGFLGLIQIIEATAENLSALIIAFLKKIGLNITKLIGLGTDGANNLCGAHHSVFTILKSHSPRLQLIKCIPHSLHLCTGKAADELPSQLDFIAKETYNWFSCSTIRRSKYKQTYDLININTNNTMHQFLKLSDTRWLVRALVVKNILEQWLELKTHFSTITEKCYMARLLKEMFNDHQNYLYYVFLSPILNAINRVNLLFQSNNTDMFRVYGDLYQLLLGIVKRCVKPVFLNNVEEICKESFNNLKKALENPLALLSIDHIDYRILFREYASTNNVSQNVLVNVKTRCLQFLLTLAQELLKRIPYNLNLINAVKYLHPEKCLSLYNRPKFTDLPLELLDENVNKAELESQWKDLTNVKWTEYIGKEAFTSEEFWVSAYNFTNSGGEFVFRDIAELALSVLSLPLSNAVVERMFSIMNCTKTKARNRLHLDMLEGLLQIKAYFMSRNICCINFEPTNLMLQKFNSTMYHNDNETKNCNAVLASLEETITLFADDGETNDYE